MSTSYALVLEDGNRITAAKALYESIVRAGSAPIGSVARSELSDEFATMAYHQAATSLSASIDHLWTVAHVVSKEMIPAFALMSLLRTGHECALVAEWLLEPDISTSERSNRGIGAQIADYAERAKFERVAGLPTGERSVSADARSEALLLRALESGASKWNEPKEGKKPWLVPERTLPSAIQLFKTFETRTVKEPTGHTAVHDGEWIYRYLSGFAHGKQWAMVTGMESATPATETRHPVARIVAGDRPIAVSMQRATDAACRAAESYEALHRT